MGYVSNSPEMPENARGINYFRFAAAICDVGRGPLARREKLNYKHDRQSNERLHLPHREPLLNTASGLLSPRLKID